MTCCFIHYPFHSFLIVPSCFNNHYTKLHTIIISETKITYVNRYVFEIHKENFNDGIALVMADAMNNKRGAPNLVDQADTVAGGAFPSGLFGEKIRREFLMAGMGEYWDLIDEHMLRD